MQIPLRLSPWLLLVGLAMWPAGAHGQKIDVAALEVTTSAENVNIEGCADAVITISVATTQVPLVNEHSSWVLEAGDGCADTEPTDPYVTCQPGQEGCCEKLLEATMPTADTVGTQTTFPVADAFDCTGDPKTEVSFHFKVQSLDTNLDNQWTAAKAKVDVDLVRPEPPTQAPEAVAGESTATITWEAVGSESEPSYRAYVFTGDFDPAVPIGGQSVAGLRASTKGTDTQAGFSGLDVDVTYRAVVATFDKAGNESLPSDAKEFETAEVTDFYELYRYSGGGDPGGFCATTPGRRGAGATPLVLLVVLGVLLAARRRRRAAVLLVLAALLAPAAALADSPRVLTFEFRIGFVKPDVDAEFTDAGRAGLPGPYEQFFGDEDINLIDLECAAHVYQGYGTAAVGFGLGTGSVSAKGHKADGTRSDEESELSLYPVSLFASYAFDWPMERWGFPLVPYAKLGLDWVIWQITDGSDDTSSTKGPNGRGLGATWGYHYSLGLRLVLDALAPDMARAFDLDMGVNNSYLFAEYFSATVDDFGDANALHLGDDTVFFGLAFDF